MQKKKTYIILTLTLTFILMIFSILLFVYVFKEIKIKNENASLISKRLDKKITQKNNLVNLQKTINTTKEQREILRSYIVDENHIDEFIGWLERQGDLLNVNVSVDAVDKAKEENALDITLGATGNFNSVMNFVSFIENSKYKIEVERLSLSKNTEEASEGKEGRVYWQAQFTFNVISENIIEVVDNLEDPC